MEYAGIVYGRDPDDPFYRLSRDDLRAMDLVGLPVKIEHLNIVAGRVTSSKLMDDGTLMVRYRLNKDVPGYVADQLIKDGKMTELSMSHTDDGRTKTPTEVSVVFRGARPGTKIISRDHLKAGCKDSPGYIKDGPGEARFVKASYASMSESAAVPETAAKPEEPSVAGDVPAAAVLPATDEPEPKRQKTAAEVPQEGQPSADAAPTDRLKLLQQIEANTPDLATKKLIYGLTNDLLNEIMEKEKMCQSMDDEIKSLNEVKQKTEANTERSARATAKSFGELFEMLTPNYVKNDALSDEFVRTMTSNPQVYEFLRPIEVCASRIKAELEQRAVSQQEQELLAARKRCEQLQSQLGVYGRMGGHLSREGQQLWKGAPAAEPAAPVPAAPTPTAPAVAAPAAAPAVLVAASAGGKKQEDDGGIPEFLRRNLGTYNNGAYGSNRVMPDDFSRPIVAKNQ